MRTPSNANPERKNPRGSLDGIRVLDLSRVLAGPLCTQMLADHGADVVKVEPPAGDDTRWLGPPFEASGDAAYFSAVNRGKRAIGLDLARPEGKAVLLHLLEQADVLVENFIPGTMKRWGLDYEADLSARFPRLIYCRISGFGADGPLGALPGYDAVLQAMCGLMSINGEPASGATRIGVPIVDHLTGYTALSGILMALHERHRSGRGQAVEATLFDAALSLLVPHAANWLSSGATPELLGSAHPNIAPYDKFMCGDGEIFLGILNDGQFRRFCDSVGCPELAADPRFVSNALRLAHRPELRSRIEAVLSACSRQALCQRLMQCGVPAGPVNTVAQAFGQAHTQHRRMVVERDGYRGVGLPVRLSRTPGTPGSSPPGYARHTEEVMAVAGIPAREVAALRDSGALPDRPQR
ncbi:CaiB/BaiF CoA transferase family protein [Variovorax saccharolyticus]|uniref:CaiB/BaiF CoA transferase family protein n=1 Tax=Variovorax saccharolyticus TaxID=3053516 RepID=UPI0025777BE6|nr:CoA transferase [Variovorax sp. J31P216]MDM0026680.1 CoA transferase [Variovorax sp. J31P216]